MSSENEIDLSTTDPSALTQRDRGMMGAGELDSKPADTEGAYSGVETEPVSSDFSYETSVEEYFGLTPPPHLNDIDRHDRFEEYHKRLETLVAKAIADEYGEDLPASIDGVNHEGGYGLKYGFRHYSRRAIEEMDEFVENGRIVAGILIEHEDPIDLDDDETRSQVGNKLRKEWQNRRPPPTPSYHNGLRSVSPQPAEDRLSFDELPQKEQEEILKPLRVASELFGPEAYKIRQATETLASALHENWRETRRNEDGTFEPRIKETKDDGWIHSHDFSTEVDIANTSYEDLPEDWQRENRNAAEVVVKLLNLGVNEVSVDLANPGTRSEIGQAIHEAWLSRNDWASGGELDVHFDKLSSEEQAKDIEQIEIALSLFKT